MEEFLPWCSGLRIRLQRLKSLGRRRFDPLPGAVGQGCGIPTAVTQMRSRAQELPYATDAAIKKKNKMVNGSRDVVKERPGEKDLSWSGRL